MTTLGISIPDDFECIKLSSFPLCLILPPNHRLTTTCISDFNELEQEDFIVYCSSRNTDPDIVIKNIFQFTPKISHRASSPFLIPSLVKAGLGIALLPSAFITLAEESGCTVKHLPEVTKNMDISCVFRKNNRSPLIDNFINLLSY